MTVYQLSDGSTWSSGERVRNVSTYQTGVVVADDSPEYLERYEPTGDMPVYNRGSVGQRDYVPVLIDGSTLVGLYPDALERLAPVGFELGGRSFIPGEQYQTPYNGVVTVLAQDDPEYLRFNDGTRSEFFVPVREASGRVNGMAPNALTPVIPSTPTQETTTMTNPTFSADQQQFLREVVGRIGEQHRACSVAAQALRELGVEQPQLTTEAVVTITLRVPLVNSSGQVQLPPAPARGYLGSVVDTTTLNRLADKLINDAGGRYERRGDATAEITNVAS